MKKKELAEILKYSRSDRLYVVNEKGKLALVKCPFRVVALKSVQHIIAGKVYSVNRVMITPRVRTVYVINEKAFLYYYFEIIIN